MAEAFADSFVKGSNRLRCRYCSSRGKARGKREGEGGGAGDVGSQLACVFGTCSVETDEVKQPQVAPEVASEEAFLDSEPFNISSDD